MRHIARTGAFVYLALTQAQIILAAVVYPEITQGMAVAMSLFVAGAALVGFAAGVEQGSMRGANSESESPPAHGTGK